MSLGISRKCVGDISLEENLAIVYVSDKVSKFVKLELNRVKKQNVVLTDDFKGRIPKPQEFLNIRSTVASKRLDCIVSAITNFSRAKSAKLINEKKVRVNGEYIDSVSAKINENDKIVIHGFGKLIVDGLSLETRKKKIALLARKYK
jgi:RNA-binding protein YlmH